jgi:hypothetical protein
MPSVISYGFGDVGISKKPARVLKEYVEITNQRELANYKKQGFHDALGVVMNSGNGLSKNSSIQLHGTFTVGYREAVDVIGSMTTQGQDALLHLMGDLIWNAESNNQSVNL